MKKVTSKILSVLLAMTLVFTTAGVAFADSGEVQADLKATTQSVKTAPAADKTSIEKGAVTTKSGKTAVMSSDLEEPAITAASMLYSTSKEAAWTAKTVEPGYCAIIPVVAKSTGLMYMDSYTTTANGSDYASVYLVDSYTVDAATGEVSWMYYDWHYLAPGESEMGKDPIPVTANKTYYIIVSGESYNDYAVTAYVRAKVYTTGARSLTQGTSYYVNASGMNQAGDANSTFFTIKPTKSGLMTVYVSEPGATSASANITLYNSSKKAVSDTISVYTSNSTVTKAVFGVKKGTTYYVKVGNVGMYSNNYIYGVKYDVSSLTDKNYSKKAKAKTLKRKAKATANLFTASTGTSTDWYKFKVTSKRQTVLTVNTAGMDSGKVTVTVYKGSKKVGTTTINNSYSNGGKYTVTYGTTYGKANSGTYYVKVVKSKTASGKYTIRYTK